MQLPVYVLKAKLSIEWIQTEVPVSRHRPAENYAETAYAKLCDAILEGRLPPGTPLSRRILAAEYGMSAVPVGEALARLEAEGFVETRPRAGSRVRIPTAEEIAGNYELREALETHSARLFAESATPLFRKRLLTAASRLDAEFRSLGMQPYAARLHAQVERQHTHFHLLIAEATRCPVLIGAIERSRVLLFNWLFSVSGEFGVLPVDWHGSLADRLVHGSAAEAAEAMRIHVRYRKQEVIEKLARLIEAPSARMSRGPQRRRNGATRS